MSDIIAYASTYIGKKETKGSNLGPQLTTWGKAVFGPNYFPQPLPWCGIFVFAMLMEFNMMTRAEVTKALGFPLFYPEGATSWLLTAKAAKAVTTTPKLGDIFLWMKPKANGVGYQESSAHHVGFVAQDGFKLVAGKPFKTLEGNTTEAGTGLASREGTSVAAKSRVWQPGAFTFVSIPKALVLHQA